MSKPGNMCAKAQREIAHIFPCYVRVSRRGVPHVVLKLTSGREASVCYFGRARKYRGFFPYCEFNEDQTKSPMLNLDGLMSWLEELDEHPI